MSRTAPPPAPTYAQLRAFHAVAVARSFTEAAQALGVSQPAVSMHVRALEDAYGVELLTRGRPGVEATELGRALLDTTRPMFSLEAEAAELLQRATALLRGRLRVGADGPFLIVPVLAAFRRAHPEVALTLALGNSSAALRDLLDGRTDVAAFSDRVEDPRLFAVPAAKSAQVVIVAREHAWAKRRGVRLRDLHGAPMVMREEGSVTRRAIEAALDRAGVRPEVVMELGSREAVHEAVAAGIGAGVVIEAERGNDDRVVALPLLDATIEHIEYVACLEERRRLRAVKAFFELVPRLPRSPKRKRG
jgi:LysR family transcriptional regulator, low CO2-responsive transcriptional regulator